MLFYINIISSLSLSVWVFTKSLYSFVLYHSSLKDALAERLPRNMYPPTIIKESSPLINMPSTPTSYSKNQVKIPINNIITVSKDMYQDAKGKEKVDEKILRNYIKNIYATLLERGMYGIESRCLFIIWMIKSFHFIIHFFSKLLLEFL